MDKYVSICLQYGITEAAINDYIDRELILHEEINTDDAKYNDYVEKCRRQGINPKNKNDYFTSRAKNIKRLKVAAGVATGLAAAGAASRHTKVGRNIRMGISNKITDSRIQMRKDNNIIRKNAKRNKKRLARYK